MNRAQEDALIKRGLEGTYRKLQKQQYRCEGALKRIEARLRLIKSVMKDVEENGV